jgi:uncharacterized repeat protein (TIGR03837 family)
MPDFSSSRTRWDIFCNVVDNFGDIGVCWRLARQLAAEYGFAVRLWVDTLECLQAICPEVDSTRLTQFACGVDVRRWSADWTPVAPGDVVIEAFGCRLPFQFEESMASRTPIPVWVNLEYLSAEPWVDRFHARPSPHPRLPLVKYVYFPGFTDGTGGLLRECDLEAHRRAFGSVGLRDFWQRLGLRPPPAEALRISLFSYENPAIDALLAAWASGEQPVFCFLPLSRNLPQVESFAKRTLRAGDVVHCGRLHLHVLPWVAQPDYDRLLWACDLNFVRGEDSFVRAQWAGRPMLWHIYPQEGNGHVPKLNAFLDRYCAVMPDANAILVRQMMLGWNHTPGAGPIDAHLWERWLRRLPDIKRHAELWRETLGRQTDLAGRLVQFCRERRMGAV